MRPEERHIALSMARLRQARDCLAAAQALVDSGLYKDSANRSYYCIFHAMRAVLALDAYDSKKHSGIISAFRQRYVKTGIFTPELSRVIEDAFDVRNDSDYDDFYVISKAEVEDQIRNAEVFLLAVETYIENL